MICFNRKNKIMKLFILSNRGIKIDRKTSCKLNKIMLNLLKNHINSIKKHYNSYKINITT